MKGLRIGVHVNENYAADRAVDYCARVKPSVMKWLNPSPDIIARCKAASPATEHISRVVFDRQSDDGEYRRFVNATLERARALRGLVKWHEGRNEYLANDATPAAIRKFAGEEVNLARELNAIGVGALIGGFSTGTLDGGKVDAFGEAFAYMQAVGPDLCALHAHYYGGGYMALNVKTPDGLNQWPDGGSWTGATTDAQLYDDPNLRGWLYLRHRDLRPLLLARGWDRVTLYITESGVDAVHKNPGGQRGFRDYRGTEWERLPGMGDFASQMRWAAVQLGHDDWVRGAVDFGFAGARSGWGDFDLNEDTEMLERFIAEQRTIQLAGSAGATPAPGGTPVSTPAPATPSLGDALHAEFGDAFEDLRATLPSNPGGPNGPFSTRSLSIVKYLAFHHTAGDKRATWAQVAQGHIAREWAGIGYHFGIRSGRLSYLGDIGTSRANVADQNPWVIGTCFAGDYTREALAPEDAAIARRLVKVLDAYLGRALPCEPHSKWVATACPGDPIRALLPTLRAGATTTTPAGPAFGSVLLAAGAAAQVIRLNRASALQKAITAAGLVATSNEFEVVHDGVRYVAQLAENATTGAVAVYVVKVGDWGNVGSVPRP